LFSGQQALPCDAAVTSLDLERLEFCGTGRFALIARSIIKAAPAALFVKPDRID
jgi:hypothetical protein